MARDTMQYDHTAYADTTHSERADCAVRAVSVAACLSYDEVYALFASVGRRAGKPTQISITEQVITQLFPGVHYCPTWGITLTSFLPEHNLGHYVVHVPNHLIAVCDGVVYDWRLRRYRRIHGYWRVC